MVISDVFQFLFGLVSSKNQMLRDINHLRDGMQNMTSDLIPFTADEFGLVSYNVANSSQSRGFYRTTMGVVTTIYYEHLFAYNIRMYGERQYACVIKTDIDEYALVSTKDNNIMVYMNQKELGHIMNNSQLYNTRNQLIGTIDVKNTPSHKDIHIKGVPIGYMIKNDKESTYLLRAVELVKSPTSDELYLSAILVFNQLILDILKK